MLKQHLREAHGLTPDEYRAQFPDALTTSPERTERARRYMSARNRESWKDPEYREYMRKALRESAPTRMKGCRNGLAEDRRKNPEKYLKIASMGGKAHIEAHGQRFLTEGKLASEKFHKQKSEQMRDLAIRNHETPGFDQMLTELAIKSHNGKKEYMAENGETVRLRSSWELKVYNALLSSGLDFSYEPFFIRYSFDGKQRRYYPDFFVEATNVLIEVKPDCFLDAKYEAKRRASLDEGFKFVHIGADEVFDREKILNLVQPA